MRLQELFALLLAPTVLVGCADDLREDGSADDDADAKRFSSWVVVERVDGDGRLRTNVSAKFVQVSEGDTAAAERLVSARPSIPNSGDCVAIASLEETAAQDQQALLARRGLSVDLVDVGDVTLTIHEPSAGSPEPLRVILAPRAFPDIGDLVSGVFYTSPDAALGLPAPADFEITGSGSPSVDAFAIDVAAPEAPSDVSIGGDELVPEDDDADVIVRRGRDIELAWAPLVASEGKAAVVYVDVRTEPAGGAGAGSAYRCAFPDGGGAVLPSDLIAAADERAMVSLHRVVERPVTIKNGAEVSTEATIVFDFARSMRVSVR